MGRTEEKNELLRESSRQKIITAALSQFSQKGLSATRIQDIAEEAGISQGLLYRHYASKDEIFVDLIDDALEKLSQSSAMVLEMKVSASEKLILSIERLFEVIVQSERFRQTCRLIAQAMNSTAIPEKAHQLLEEKRIIPYKAYAQIICQGQLDGDVVQGDPYELAVLFWSTINGLAVYQVTRQQEQHFPDSSLMKSMFIKRK